MEQARKLKYLEDHQIGDVVRSLPYAVTPEEIIAFASKWDPQPWHIDEELAKQSPYGGLTACSAHIFAIFTGLATSLPEQPAAIAGLGFDEIRVLRPLRAGDSVSLVSECIEARRSRTKHDRGIVRSRGVLISRAGETVFSIISTFMVQSREGGGSHWPPRSR
jgi:acyl dehydratase